MRYFDDGDSYRVSVFERDIQAFIRRWPSAGLHTLKGVTFVFHKKNNDLINVRFRNGSAKRWNNKGEAALAALSRDAIEYARIVRSSK